MRRFRGKSGTQKWGTWDIRKGMNDEQRSEARQLIADLEAACSRLRIQDRRFVFSWRQYLDRLGNRAEIGVNRLTVLRRIHGSYYPMTKQEAARCVTKH